MENLSIVFGIALSADDDASTRTMACHALCASTVNPPFLLLFYYFIFISGWETPVSQGPKLTET